MATDSLRDLSGRGGRAKLVPRSDAAGANLPPGGGKTERVDFYNASDQEAARAAEFAAIGYVTPRRLRRDQQSRMATFRRLIGTGLRRQRRGDGVL